VIDVAFNCSRFRPSEALEEQREIVAGNHVPRWLGLPRGGRDRGPKYSRLLSESVSPSTTCFSSSDRSLREVFQRFPLGSPSEKPSAIPPGLRRLAEPVGNGFGDRSNGLHHPTGARAAT